jgi:L-alanine-DL-glutamate epimerase-like enolase superfamily enzyme
MPLIESIDLLHYRVDLDPPFRAAWDPTPRTNFGATVVKIRAGNYVGVGSGEAMYGFRGHEALFLGQDPFHIERHVRILDNLQFHYGRMWPIEVALWDLMGQITGQPIWKLLGGGAGRVRPYASTGERLPARERAASARRLQTMGFPAIKIRFHSQNLEEDLDVVRAVRDAVGRDMEILVDANQGWQMPWDSATPWDLKTARYVADALDELNVFWLEEPLHRHHYEGLAELRQHSRLRIAGGEGNREYADLLQYLKHGSLDVFQPDVVWSTGVWRAQQLAAAVQSAGSIYSPHTWGDGLVMLANLQVAAGISSAPFIEYPYDPPHWTPERRDFLLPEPLTVDPDGWVYLPKAPGLGVELDWDGLERHRITDEQAVPWKVIDE